MAPQSASLQANMTDSLISDYFKARNMTYKAVAFENTNQRYEYYENGRCDVVTSEIPFLGTRGGCA